MRRIPTKLKKEVRDDLIYTCFVGKIRL